MYQVWVSDLKNGQRYDNISLLSPVVSYEQLGTTVTMANNRQRYIVQNMSHGYCLKVTKFHCNSFSDLRANDESSVYPLKDHMTDRVN